MGACGLVDLQKRCSILEQSQGDHTFFIKHTGSGGITALLVYVDDLIVTG